MKKYIAVITVLMGVCGYSQEIPRDLKLAVKGNYRFVADSLSAPDFTYYSKNYDKVFGPSLYTEDYMSYETRALMINYGDIYYKNSYHTPRIFQVMPMAGVNVDACMAQPNNVVYSIEGR